MRFEKGFWRFLIAWKSRVASFLGFRTVSIHSVRHLVPFLRWIRNQIKVHPGFDTLFLSHALNSVDIIRLNTTLTYTNTNIHLIHCYFKDFFRSTVQVQYRMLYKYTSNGNNERPSSKQLLFEDPIINCHMWWIQGGNAATSTITLQVKVKLQLTN